MMPPPPGEPPMPPPPNFPEDLAELDSVFDAAWPCSSEQYDRTLSVLRDATSLAAQRPEAALKHLADDRKLSELRAVLRGSPSDAEAFACITTSRPRVAEEQAEAARAAETARAAEAARAVEEARAH